MASVIASARTQRGGWGPTPAWVAHSVLPTLYDPWWFLSTTALALALCAWALLRLRRQQVIARTEGALEERTRLARELHDTLLQSFTGIALQLRAYGARPPAGDSGATHNLRALASLAETTLREARRAVWDMRAPAAALPARLEAAAWDAVNGLPVALDCRVAGRQRHLGPQLEAELARIGREAIANAVRHGAPRRIAVSLVYERRAVRLTVHDDGRGFADDVATVAAASAARGHFGLVGMRERAERVGAQLTVHSAPGRGTEVTAVVPEAQMAS